MAEASAPFVVPSILLGDIKVGVLTRRDWAARIVDHCRYRAPGAQPLTVFAANGQVIALAAREPAFRAVFGQADAVTADGQSLVWASRLTRHPLPERAATTDLFHDVARAAETVGASFYLLGTTARNLAIAEACIRDAYPRLVIAGSRHGYFGPDEEAGVLGAVGAAKPDVLWVGMGAKRQAEFVAANLHRLTGIGCIVTCGGLFDYFTPDVRRAPRWMQDMSLEWLFRTWQEPRKYLWRYLVTNPMAAYLLLTRTRSL